MSRNCPFTVSMLLWALVLAGCNRAQEKPDGAAEPLTDSLLKTEDSAGTIVKKAVSAHGGEKAFSQWSCGYLKYRTRGGAFPAQAGEVTLEDTFQLPGHFKRVMRMDAGGEEVVTVFVINHGNGWTKQGDRPAEPKENNFTEQTQHPFAGYSNLSPCLDEDVRLTKVGGEKVNGRETITIRTESEKLGTVDFNFDSATGLLRKLRKTVRQERSDELSVIESFFDQHKEVNGTQIPMRIKTERDGKTILDVTVVEAKFTDRFEESAFAKP